MKWRDFIEWNNWLQIVRKWNNDFIIAWNNTVSFELTKQISRRIWLAMLLEEEYKESPIKFKKRKRLAIFRSQTNCHWTTRELFLENKTLEREKWSWLMFNNLTTILLQGVPFLVVLYFLTWRLIPGLYSTKEDRKFLQENFKNIKFEQACSEMWYPFFGFKRWEIPWIPVHSITILGQIDKDIYVTFEKIGPDLPFVLNTKTKKELSKYTQFWRKLS